MIITEKYMELLHYHSSLPPDHDNNVDNSETVAPPVEKLMGLAAVLKHREVVNCHTHTSTAD